MSNGELRIVAAEELGTMGRIEGPPTHVQWRWYYALPTLPLWGLLGLLLLVPRANRTPQAWLIAIPPLLMAGFGQLILLAGPSSAGANTFAFSIVTLAVTWSSVWLLAPWIATTRRTKTAFWALLVTLVVNVLAYSAFEGPVFSAEVMQSSLGGWLLGASPLILATSLSGYYCRRDPLPARALLWLFLWLPVATIVGAAIFFTVTLSAQSTERGVFILASALLMSVFAGGFLSAGLYLFNLPTMLLAQASPFYRDRFRMLFAMPDPDDSEDSPFAEGAEAVTPAELVEHADEGESPFGSSEP